jgi:PPK2 family polyphosphate:nucleotide phosphotransferase
VNELALYLLLNKKLKMAAIKLNKISTKAPKKLHKETIKKETEKLKIRIGELQNILYAEGKHSVLVVLQGLDASGKDGAIKNVFDAVNPLGCRVFPFKKPTEEEMKHDFLWRIHKCTPERGMIHIFGRSHYEDVLIQRVHNWIDEKTVKQRFVHINNFEKLLIESGTVVLKFYLHISPEVQLKRLKERTTDPTKNWKYNVADMEERKFWKDYREAYEAVFENCQEAADWHIIPSDQNWIKEYLISKKIVEVLESLKLTFPAISNETK